MMRLFKAETGYTIGNYITYRRLLLARSLILKGVPITQACLSSGFQDYSTFSRAYKAEFQEPPRFPSGSACSLTPENISLFETGFPFWFRYPAHFLLSLLHCGAVRHVLQWTIPNRVQPRSFRMAFVNPVNRSKIRS